MDVIGRIHLPEKFGLRQGTQMTTVEFTTRFDEHGHYRPMTGTENVVFVARTRRRYLGQLHFHAGLCVRAEMEGGGDWCYPDNAPLNEISFLLQFDDDQPVAAAIEHGKLFFVQKAAVEASRQEFLANLRVARNLFAHPKVFAGGGAVDEPSATRTLVRAEIWLTPKSVAGFNASHFPELGTDRQRELDAAVKAFLTIAEQVPANAPASSDQFHGAAGAFAKILEILRPYLPVPDEARIVDRALGEAAAEFPAWVLNFDYELGSDSDGVSAVWIDIFVDEASAPLKQLGRYASDFTAKIRTALVAAGSQRWPYMRMRTSTEHKARA